MTLDDDGNFAPTPEEEARGAELGLRFEAWLARGSFNSDQMRLLRLIESQTKANAADLESWEEYHFTIPPFALNGGIQRARQVFGGSDGLEKMLASLNAALFSDAADGDHDAAARSSTK